MKETAIKQEPKWVDTHCHLQLTDYDLADLSFEFLEYLILPGVDVDSSKKAKELGVKINPRYGFWDVEAGDVVAANVTGDAVAPAAK